MIQSIKESKVSKVMTWQFAILYTSDFAFSIDEAIASNATCPSTNHWAWLPSSVKVKPLCGAKEPKRWGLHQASFGFWPVL